MVLLAFARYADAGSCDEKLGSGTADAVTDVECGAGFFATVGSESACAGTSISACNIAYDGCGPAGTFTGNTFAAHDFSHGKAEILTVIVDGIDVDITLNANFDSQATAVSGITIAGATIETVSYGSFLKITSASASVTVSITSSVATSATSTTITHVAGTRALVVGDTLTVTGHTGNQATQAMNQAFTVASITSTTIAVLTGTGMTAGTPGTPTIYNTGTIVGVYYNYVSGSTSSITIKADSGANAKALFGVGPSKVLEDCEALIIQGSDKAACCYATCPTNIFSSPCKDYCCGYTNGVESNADNWELTVGPNPLCSSCQSNVTACGAPSCTDAKCAATAATKPRWSGQVECVADGNNDNECAAINGGSLPKYSKVSNQCVVAATSDATCAAIDATTPRWSGSAGTCVIKAGGTNAECANPASMTSQATCDSATTAGAGDDAVANACVFTASTQPACVADGNNDDECAAINSGSLPKYSTDLRKCVALCTAVDTPYAGCIVPSCTAVDTPYAGCTLAACTAVDTPYAGCTLAACTAVDTPYAGCTLAACTSVDTPYAGCTVTGKCTGNTGATGDVDCSTEATNTVNKGATVTGTDAAACCEAPATNTGSESLSPSARAMKDEASRFEKAKAIARKAGKSF